MDYVRFPGLAVMNMTMKEQYGHQLEDMMVFCTFDGEQCTMNDFQFTYSPYYGNCYTFNAVSQNNRTAKKSGPLYGKYVHFVNIIV